MAAHAARRRDQPIEDPAAWTAAALRAGISLSALRAAADSCRGCPLWRRATQTVFGRGTPDSGLMLVGEQPGDVEDRVGEPFVGPAGRLLERALQAAGTSRDQVYLTNAVKHFSWQERGKARIHKKPRPAESRACRPWLISEIEVLAPRVVLALGATAAHALLGSAVRVLRDRGKPMPSPLAPAVYVTVHPSALLREPDEAARHAAFDALVADLRTAHRAARKR